MTATRLVPMLRDRSPVLPAGVTDLVGTSCVCRSDGAKFGSAEGLTSPDEEVVCNAGHRSVQWYRRETDGG
jgi:hypothetical protein